MELWLQYRIDVYAYSRHIYLTPLYIYIYIYGRLIIVGLYIDPDLGAGGEKWAKAG